MTQQRVIDYNKKLILQAAATHALATGSKEARETVKALKTWAKTTGETK